MSLPPIMLIGCGRMGRAMLAGWIEKGVPPGQITVIQRGQEKASSIKRAYGVDVHERPDADAGSAGIVVLAVKPQTLAELMPHMKPLLNAGSLIISVAAGKPIAFYEKALGEQPLAIVRAMPNLPSLITEGVTGLVKNTHVTATQQMQAERLFSVLGKTLWLQEEEEMHALTAISGSGPAYVFYFMKSLIDAGVKAGLTKEQAELLVRHTIEGSVHLANQSTESLEQLRANVTSPGGTTAAAFEIFEKNSAFQQLIEDAVKAAAARSKALI